MSPHRHSYTALAAAALLLLAALPACDLDDDALVAPLPEPEAPTVDTPARPVSLLDFGEALPMEEELVHPKWYDDRCGEYWPEGWSPRGNGWFEGKPLDI